MSFWRFPEQRLTRKEPTIETKTFVALTSLLRSLDPKVCSYCLDILEFFLERRKSNDIFDLFEALNVDQILCFVLQNLRNDEVRSSGHRPRHPHHHLLLQRRQ